NGPNHKHRIQSIPTPHSLWPLALWPSRSKRQKIYGKPLAGLLHSRSPASRCRGDEAGRSPPSSACPCRTKYVPLGITCAKAKGETRARSESAIVRPLARRSARVRLIWTVFHTTTALDNRLRQVALFIISS